MVQLFDDATHEFYSQLIRLVFILCAVDEGFDANLRRETVKCHVYDGFTHAPRINGVHDEFGDGVENFGVHSGNAIGDGVNEVRVIAFPNDRGGLEARPELLHGVSHEDGSVCELIILEDEPFLFDNGSQLGEVLNVLMVFHEVLKQLLVVGIQLEFVWLEKNDPAVVVRRIVDEVGVDFHFTVHV